MDNTYDVLMAAVQSATVLLLFLAFVFFVTQIGGRDEDKAKRGHRRRSCAPASECSDYS